jgi:hypothetical protein
MVVSRQHIDGLGSVIMIVLTEWEAENVHEDLYCFLGYEDQEPVDPKTTLEVLEWQLRNVLEARWSEDDTCRSCGGLGTYVFDEADEPMTLACTSCRGTGRASDNGAGG